MDILGVTQTSHEGGIEFADLDSVKNALRIFADGVTPGSRETSHRGFDSSPTGGIGLMMKMILDDRRESGFMQELLTSVDRVTEERGMHRSYDYDGMGPFFKTTVEVKKIKVGRRQFVYLLHLNAAYVGDQPCAGLATTLGANRALWRDEVIIELAPTGDRFEIDFNLAAERLASIGLSKVSGRQLADHSMELAATSTLDDDRPELPLRNDELVVTFGIVSYSVERPIDYQTRKMVWSQSGSVISGPLAQGYEGEKYSKPRLYASISVPATENECSWDRKPILNPTLKQTIHDQAAAIVGAFQ